MERSWLTSWVGQTVPVLFEEEKGGFWRGYTPQYVEVFVQGAGLHNRFEPSPSLRQGTPTSSAS